MQVERDGHRAIVTLESYEDLLVVRAVPEYRFVARDVVECDWNDLAELGTVDLDRDTVAVDKAPHLFDYQAWIVDRAYRKERYAIFADTGLGKTAMQLEWARLAIGHEGRALIVAPLNVVRQTIAEAARFYGDAMPVQDVTARDQLDAWCDSGVGVAITNYEKFDRAGPGDRWGDGSDRLDIDAVVLDESSMLKAFGPRKFAIMRAFDGVRYKLACTATPAPNQRTEFAQHAVFLHQVRSSTEYLTAYFMNRDGDWQFKPHSREAWAANLASWAVFVRDPKAWKFADHLADLPPKAEFFPHVDLTDEQRHAARGYEQSEQPSLFGATPGGIVSRTKMMQIAHGFELKDGQVVARYPAHKPAEVARLATEEHPDDSVIVWVTFDEEGDQLATLIDDSIHLSGSTAPKTRDTIIESFRVGEGPRVLILKPAMFGFGVNLQACSVQIFSTITDSFERYYQCIRRSYRFGQTKPVTIYVPLTDLDTAIAHNTLSKQSTFLEDAMQLESEVVARLRPVDTSEVRNVDTAPKVEISRAGTDRWTIVHADCIAHMPTMPRGEIDLCVFSPPFAALYAYSKELADMGNVRGDDEFRWQWQQFAERLLPVMRPGRVVAIHAKEIIRFANSHGYRHAYDFPSELREGMVAAGFNYQRRITIEKNPQLEATRNKETSLLHVTALRDAASSMPQTGEYLMVFTAPGDNEVPVTHSRDEHSFERHTVWMNSIWHEEPALDQDEAGMLRWLYPDGFQSTWRGIRETDVLNAMVAKETPEERHVCPLQLSLIDRCVELWTNPGELVFSPFTGIGSEGWSAIGLGRRFYGCELKESYFETAQRYLAQREAAAKQASLFDNVAPMPFETAVL